MSTITFGTAVTTDCTACHKPQPAGHLVDLERRIAAGLVEITRNWVRTVDYLTEDTEFAATSSDDAATEERALARLYPWDALRRLARMLTTYTAHEGANTDTARQVKLTILREFPAVTEPDPHTGQLLQLG